MKQKVLKKHEAKCRKILSKYYDYFEKDGNFTEKILYADLCKIKKSLQILHSYWYGYCNDHRTGIETYGFSGSKKDFNIYYCLNQVSYISDRFCAEFRLKWLLDLFNILTIRINN